MNYYKPLSLFSYVCKNEARRERSTYIAMAQCLNYCQQETSTSCHKKHCGNGRLSSRVIDVVFHEHGDMEHNSKTIYYSKVCHFHGEETLFFINYPACIKIAL